MSPGPRRAPGPGSLALPLPTPAVGGRNTGQTLPNPFYQSIPKSSSSLASSRVTLPSFLMKQIVAANTERDAAQSLPCESLDSTEVGALVGLVGMGVKVADATGGNGVGVGVGRGGADRLVSTGNPGGISSTSSEKIQTPESSFSHNRSAVWAAGWIFVLSANTPTIA